jgi:hypothetical protein
LLVAVLDADVRLSALAEDSEEEVLHIGHYFAVVEFVADCVCNSSVSLILPRLWRFLGNPSNTASKDAPRPDSDSAATELPLPPPLRRLSLEFLHRTHQSHTLL